MNLKVFPACCMSLLLPTLVMSAGEPAKMTGFIPGPTLADDLKDLQVPLVAGYSSQHPRLLFSAADREKLRRRAEERPDLWQPVLDSAKALKSPDSVPAPELIRGGERYFLVEKVKSAALAYFITGDATYKDGAVRWMLAHAKEPVWGDKYRPNLDLVASWYLYHVAVGYDILKGEMSEEERRVIRDGLADHARAIFVDQEPDDTREKIRYDQNHTYIPTVAMISASLALLEDVPEAADWLKRGYAVLRRCRYVQSEDGYYYEGFGYWTYALNWHVRGAELLTRATGEDLYQIPVLRDSWRFGLHLSLPGHPGAYGVGDHAAWKDSKQNPIKVNNYAMLWELAAQTGSTESRAVGDLYHARLPERDYPATAFLWFDDSVQPAPLDSVKPYHYFPDHDVIAWRSAWDESATSYLFRCGPPLGHKATAKLRQFADWTMNAGHVHPDIGAFWMYAKGAYMAVDTGYTAEKWTQDHNTLLVDGKGQGMDGTYWNERGIPYEDLDQARITSQYLSADYGYASGEFGRVYQRQVPGVDLRRRLLMTSRWLLVIDDMKADQPRELTWLCHSYEAFVPEGAAYFARQPQATLAVLPLAPAGLKAEPKETTVIAGKAPGKGKPEQRGFQLRLSTPAPIQETRFINLLVPLATAEKAPEVEPIHQVGDILELKLKWPEGKSEHVRLDLGWTSGETGPATFTP